MTIRVALSRDKKIGILIDVDAESEVDERAFRDEWENEGIGLFWAEDNNPWVGGNCIEVIGKFWCDSTKDEEGIKDTDCGFDIEEQRIV